MLLKMALFHSFYGWVIFHCIYLPHLPYPVISWWAPGLLHILAIVNIAAMNTGVHVSFWIRVFIFSRYMRRSGIVGSQGSSMFNFLRNLQTVLHSGCTSLHSGDAFWRLPRDTVRPRSSQCSAVFSDLGKAGGRGTRHRVAQPQLGSLSCWGLSGASEAAPAPRDSPSALTSPPPPIKSLFLPASFSWRILLPSDQ